MNYNADYIQSPATSQRRQRVSRLLSYEGMGKRFIDLLLVLLLLPALIIIVPLLWMVVRLDGGPGFFKHKRVGKNGQHFYCWKLRTMVLDAEERLVEYLKAYPEFAEEWQNNYKLRSDPRITRIGNFLRKTSLDELPQVWNVLKGEMSFVGPRPVVMPELEYYGDAAIRCFSVRPGVTGSWQVSGRNNVDYSERVRLDLDYVNDVSFRRDMAIIAKTGAAVLMRTGR